MHHHRHQLGAMLAALLLSACASKPGPDHYTIAVDTPRPVLAATGDALSEPPYLRGVVPADALAYLRIPSPWGVLGEAKGNISDQAVGSAAYRAAVADIREGFRNHLAPQYQEGADVLWRVFMAHARSPAEFLLLPGGVGGAPRLVFSLQLDLDRPGLNRLLTEMTTALHLGIPQGIDGNGHGAIRLGRQTMRLYFDEDRQRLFALPGGDGADLHALLAAMVPVPDHPMHALEQTVDTSGQGFFFWATGAGITDVLAQLGQNASGNGMRSILSQSRGIALGWGTRDGRQRLRWVLDLPPVAPEPGMAPSHNFRRYIPLGAQMITLDAAGTPQALFMLSMPDLKDWNTLETGLMRSLKAEDMAAYKEGKARLENRLGFGVDEFLITFGKEWLYVVDEAGSYLAVPLRDERRFQALLEKAVTHFDLALKHQEVNGRMYHHLVLPSFMSGNTGADQGFWSRWSRLPSHLYWTQENGYLLMASTPQVLIDRYYQPLRTPLQTWLKNKQQQDPAGALFMATMRSEGVPRLMYDFNLQVLQSLGDFVGRPPDLFSLPTAHELNLPKSGAFTFRIDSTTDHLAMELSFDVNPVEGLFAGNGIMGLALIGMVSAIALPAYQDFTLRARVAESLASTTPLTRRLSAFYRENGRFPDASETEDLIEGSFPSAVGSIIVTPQTGEITLVFALPRLGEGNRLVLTPMITEDEVQWACAGTVAPRYAPASCR